MLNGSLRMRKASFAEQREVHEARPAPERRAGDARPSPRERIGKLPRAEGTIGARRAGPRSWSECEWRRAATLPNEVARGVGSGQIGAGPRPCFPAAMMHAVRTQASAGEERRKRLRRCATMTLFRRILLPSRNLGRCCRTP